MTCQKICFKTFVINDLKHDEMTFFKNTIILDFIVFLNIVLKHDLKHEFLAHK